jgi:hypothetical protein
VNKLLQFCTNILIKIKKIVEKEHEFLEKLYAIEAILGHVFEDFPHPELMDSLMVIVDMLTDLRHEIEVEYHEELHILLEEEAASKKWAVQHKNTIEKEGKASSKVSKEVFEKIHKALAEIKQEIPEEMDEEEKKYMDNLLVFLETYENFFKKQAENV